MVAVPSASTNVSANASKRVTENVAQAPVRKFAVVVKAEDGRMECKGERMCTERGQTDAGKTECKSSENDT